MLQLRVFGDSPAVGEIARRLGAMPGARHVSLTPGERSDSTLVTAELRTSAADGALAMVRGAGIPPEDVALVRLDAIGPAPADESAALVWADVLGQARVNARAAARYLIFMAVAGVIAAFGVIDENQVLIVGAMAVAPDLLPITAACTGLILRRARLVGQGLVAIALGLGTACILAAAVTGFLRLFDLLPPEFAVHQIGIVSQTHVEAETILVALAAGVAGMLATETRASSGVGVAISVTTIPAAAFLGVAAGIGEFSKSLGALSVLATNVAMMIVGGSTTLAIQRKLTAQGGTQKTRAGG
jgi:uncharacterized hydrophobic protein (TIGR00271 family)